MFMRMKKIGRRRRPSDFRLQAIENARHKIAVLKKSFALHLPEDNAIQFSHIVKKFFSSFFRIDYNLSYNEMKSEIEAKVSNEQLKQALASFLKSVSVMEFGGVTLSRRKISYFSQRFLSILSLAEVRARPGGEGSVIKKGIRAFEDRFGITEEKKKKEDEALERIYKLLLLGHKALSIGEISNSVPIYSEVRLAYSRLSEESKKKVHPDIIYFYKKIMKKAA